MIDVATLLLVRHGETDWNRDRRWQGHTGAPLNERGRLQAAELSGRVDQIDAVYSSDAERAYETALILAARLGLPVETDPRLREMDFGLWEGLTRAEIHERFGTSFAAWLSGERSAPDGGESDDAMAERVLAALAEIAERHRAQRILVVTSGGPIRAVEAHLRGLDPARGSRELETVDNCALFEVVTDNGTWTRPVGGMGRVPGS